MRYTPALPITRKEAVDFATAIMISLSHLVVWDAKVHHRLASDDLQVLGMPAAEVFDVVHRV
jgi:hypothetical protein